MPGLLTLVDLAAHPERYQLIDARDAQDHATAHVEGAVHIPLLELAKRLAEISPDGTPCLLVELRTWRGAETGPSPGRCFAAMRLI